MAIRELEKPAFAPCAHLAAEGGCGIWGGHPASCRSFTCLWRRSDALLPAEMFPPDSGFMLALDQVEAWPTVVKVCCDPARPDAWDQPQWRAVFSALAGAWNCLVVIVEEGVRGAVAFAPSGGVYTRAQHPQMFPDDGRGLAVPAADYGPDRRAPAERIAEAEFSWSAQGASVEPPLSAHPRRGPALRPRSPPCR